MKTESQREAAARLTHELGFEVTRAKVRHWQHKGYDLNNTESLLHNLRNQQKALPQPTATTAHTGSPVATQGLLLVRLIHYIDSLPEMPFTELFGGFVFACVYGHGKTYGEEELVKLTYQVKDRLNSSQKEKSVKNIEPKTAAEIQRSTLVDLIEFAQTLQKSNRDEVVKSLSYKH